MIPWPWLILPLFVGSAFGALAMGLVNARGPCAQDALMHLGRMYHLINNAEMCDFSNGVTYGNVDEGTVMATRTLDSARRFLLQHGEGEGV